MSVQVRESDTPTAKRALLCLAGLVVFLPPLSLESFPQSGPSRKPALIRDTAAAEEKEEAEAEPTKEYNPMLAEQNISIGNFYLKRKNYGAAIQRFISALEYQPDSVPAWEALARTYEKSGDRAKAIQTYRDFIEKNPDSPKSAQFRARLAKLEKKP